MIKTIERCVFRFSLICASLLMMLFVGPSQIRGSNTTAAGESWVKPKDWPATPESDRKSYSPYYQKGTLPKHNPAKADDLGLSWHLPLRAEDIGGQYKSLGGVYCPTLSGREGGSYGARYHGIHRGHDLGIPGGKVKSGKTPVRAIADGVYDGQRIYTHGKQLPGDCKPLIVYHFSKNQDNKIYTSIYCHCETLPGLKPGTSVKAGDVIGTVEDPKGMWGAHVHLELYTRPVYSSKDSTKLSRCGCKSDADCDAKTHKNNEIPRGCGIFEDDLYIMEPVLFIKARSGK